MVTEFYSPPRLPNRIVPRKRLFDRLDSAIANGVAIILVTGTSGAGKTTLIANWIQESSQKDIQGTWVSLGSLAKDRFGFWRHLLSQLIEAQVIADEQILNQIRNDLTPKQLEEIPATLLSGFLKLKEQLIIVIDNFEVVQDQEVIDDIAYLLKNISNLHFVINTRPNKAISWIELQAQLPFESINESDLIFTASETQTAITNSGLSLSDKLGNLLHESLGGFPLEVMICIFDLTVKEHSKIDETLILEVTNKRLSSFATSLLSKIGEEQTKELYRLSVAESLPTTLIETLSKSQQIFNTLDQVAELGLGAWYRETNLLRFEYQSLFRQTLKQRLHDTDEVLANSLYTQYANWLARNGFPMQAIKVAHSIKNWEVVSEVILENHSEIYCYHLYEFIAVLRTADIASLKRFPLLMVFYAITIYANPTSSREKLTGLFAVTSILVKNNLNDYDPMIRTWLLVALSAIQRISGKYQEASTTASRLIDLVESAETSQITITKYDNHPDSLLPQAGISKYFNGEFNSALTLFEKTISTLLPHKDDLLGAALPQAVSSAAMIYAARGHRNKAGELIALAQTITRPHNWINEYTGSNLAAAEALLYLEELDVPSALIALDRMEPHLNTIEHWPHLITIRSYSYLATGNIYEGLIALNGWLQHFRKRPATSKYFKNVLSAVHSDILLASGQFQEADRLLKDNLISTDFPESLFSRVRLNLYDLENNSALNLAQKMAWNENATIRQRIEAMLLSAVAAHRLGQQEKALDWLKQGLRLVTQHNFRYRLLTAPQKDLRELLKVQSEFSEEIFTGIPDHFSATRSNPQLTNRETEILNLLAQPYTLNDIAKKLFVSLNTVKTQVKSIYRKLEVNSREEAVAKHNLGLPRATTDSIAPPTVDPS